MGREKNITKLKYWQDSLTGKASFAAGKVVTLFAKRGIDEIVKRLGWKLPKGITGIVAGIVTPILGDMVSGVMGDKGEMISNALNPAGDSMFFDSIAETITGQKPDTIVDGLGGGTMNGDSGLLAGPYEGELLTPATMNNAHLGDTLRNMFQMKETPDGYDSIIGFIDESTGEFYPSQLVEQAVLAKRLQQQNQPYGYLSGDNEDERREAAKKFAANRQIFGNDEDSEVEKLISSGKRLW